jgi:hypothetical protein
VRSGIPSPVVVQARIGRLRPGPPARRCGSPDVPQEETPAPHSHGQAPSSTVDGVEDALWDPTGQTVRTSGGLAEKCGAGTHPRVEGPPAGARFRPGARASRTSTVAVQADAPPADRVQLLQDALRWTADAPARRPRRTVVGGDVIVRQQGEGLRQCPGACALGVQQVDSERQPAALVRPVSPFSTRSRQGSRVTPMTGSWRPTRRPVNLLRPG